MPVITGEIVKRSADSITSHLGTSRGWNTPWGDNERLQIQGFNGSEQLVAVKRSLSWYNRSSSYVQCSVQTLAGRVDVWIDKSSMTKRLCNSVAGVLKIGEALGQTEQDNVIRKIAKKCLKDVKTGDIQELRHTVFNSDVLFLSEEAVTQLPHSQFLLCADRINRNWSSYPELMELRHQYQSQLVPVCTSFEGGRFNIEMLKRSEVSKLPGVRQQGDVYITRSAFEQRSQLPSVKTKEDLDRFVQSLKTTADAIPWEYGSDGCYARAQFIIDMLVLSGFPKEDLFKQYIHIPNTGWNYHVAVGVRLNLVDDYIIDPLVETEQVLTPRDWAQAFKPKDANIWNVHNHGDVREDGRFGDGSPLEVDKLMMFTAHIDTYLNVEGRKTIVRQTREDLEENTETLAVYRLKLEVNALRNRQISVRS